MATNLFASSKQTLTPFVSDVGENLVFIFGLPRSGTTLLSLILNNHPKVFAPAEPWFLLRLYAIRNEADRCSLIDDYQLALGVREFLPDDVFIQSTRAFAMSAYNAHLQSCGKAIFVDKTPRYYHILGFIDKLFPKAKKIWLKRNLFDVATSYRNTWKVEIGNLLSRKFAPLTSDLLLGPPKLAEYFDKPDTTKHEIQYEDLTNNPESTMAALCGFLEIPFHEKMTSYWESDRSIQEHRRASMGDKKVFTARAIHAASVDGWKTQLSSAEIRLLLQVFGSFIFNRMGYSDTVSWLGSHGFLNEGRVTNTAPLYGDSKTFSDVLLREYMELLNKGTIGYSEIINEIKRIKGVADLIQVLVGEADTYRKKLAEAMMIAQAGNDEVALDIFQRLFHDNPSRREEVFQKMMPVLKKIGRKSSRSAGDLVNAICHDIHKPVN